MSSIGIIANSSSGKDIRRLVAHATVFNNNEKVNIMERIVLGAQALGVDRVYIMPDIYRMGAKVKKNLELSGELTCEIQVIQMDLMDSLIDSFHAAEFMEENKVGCIVTLGGDGTNRAVAKGVKQTPMITISTGTNNVYPVMMEGTVAGIAAAAVASGRFPLDACSIKEKRIEIFRNGKLVDLALVDAAITDEEYIASKAVWDLENIRQLFVTRSHPASIGLSSIVGTRMIVKPQDDFGAHMMFRGTGPSVLSAVSAGDLRSIVADEPAVLALEEEFQFHAMDRGTIALDGEKEVVFQEGQTITFKITRNGPIHVDTVKVLEIAQENGFFIIEKVSIS